MLIGISIIFFALVLTTIVLFFIKRYASCLKLMDVPVERSSHAVPTPRGAGLAFGGSFLVALIIFFYCKLINYQLLSAFLGGGFLVLFVGFLDDRGHVPASIRLLIHAIAAAWVLWIFHGMPSLTLGFFIWHWHKVGTAIGIIALVWLINLYNFMDGIDGLAASEAMFVGLAMNLLFILSGQIELAWITFALVATVSMFLIWNWPPAKLFMGDSGSTFLGYCFGVLIIASSMHHTRILWQWVILLGVFWVDATATLFKRIRKREKLYQAHRHHAFQIASKRWNTHKGVVLGVLVIDLVWLFPMSLLATKWKQLEVIITFIAILPLFFIWGYLNLKNEAK